ncbi:Acyl-CoA synthetase (NDP forming) [Sphingobium faniae]|nr:Acyl-CoA synthetase (NDP forming) [Sphingobium faniae]
MIDLSGLFRPKSLAIIGASDKNPWSAIAARTLKDVGFDGPLGLVNVRGSTALGRETVKSCRDLPSTDAAFLAVPAAFLSEAIEDMAAADVRYGAVVTSGFSEVGADGAAEQERIFDKARELGVTLLGPNSLGFTNFVDRVSLGAMPLQSPLLEQPRVALVSQSGATTALVAQVAHQQNVSLSYMVAMGNEAMVDLADVIHFFVTDEATRAICVFAESIRNPVAFAEAARAAAMARKPIVMLKVGVGELTATVAQAHTGALVGDDRMFQAVCDALNIVRVTSMEDLVLTADMLAALGPIDADKGFSLVSISGGACEMVADRGEEHGVPFPQFEEGTLKALSGVIAGFGAAHNPIDITGAAMSKPEIYTNVIDVVSKDRQIGLIGVISEIPLTPEGASPMSAKALEAISQGFSKSGARGFLIQQAIKPISDHGRALIRDNKLPLVTGGIDHAVRALGKLYDWSRNSDRTPPVFALESRPSTQRPSTERETLAYLKQAGVPVIPQHLAQSREEAVEAAAGMDGSVVLKILSKDIQHKTEVGGVLLNLSGAEMVGEGYDRIMASVARKRPDADIEGVLVSPMRDGGVELIVGVARDPQWGLALAVGLGGIWVELLKDTRLGILPLSVADVRDMIDGLRATALLKGYRGAEPADLDALAKAVVHIGQAALALGDDLEALEINPLRVAGGQIEALDALAIWKTA